MGNPAKPTHLKIVEGCREDRINRDEPVPDPAALYPPFELSERAQEIWDRLAPDMKARGVFTEWDADAFAQGCDCLAMYWEFRELLESNKDSEFGPYVAKGAAGGVIKHPYWQMMRDAQSMALAIFSRFGMTPADRTKLSTKDDDGQPGGLDSLIA